MASPFKSHTYLGYCTVKTRQHKLHKSRQIIAPNPEVQLLTAIHDHQNGRRPIALTQESKKRPSSPF